MILESRIKVIDSVNQVLAENSTVIILSEKAFYILKNIDRERKGKKHLKKSEYVSVIEIRSQSYQTFLINNRSFIQNVMQPAKSLSYGSVK